MGCSQTSKQISNEFDRQVSKELRNESNEERMVRKMLLFGLDGSGKSTIIKQLQIIHGKGYTNKNRIEFKMLIYNQCIQQMKSITQFINDVTVLDSQYLDAINIQIKSYDIPHNVLTESKLDVEQQLITKQKTNQLNTLCDALKYLWKHKSIQNMYNRKRFSLNLFDSTAYFMNNIDKYFNNDYIPTNQDILSVYDMNETGVSEFLFELNRCKYLIIDIHQQTTTSIDKWIHCFDMMTCIIFVLSLSCYDASSISNSELLVSGYINLIFNEAFDIPIDLIEVIAKFCPSSIIANKMQDQVELFQKVWNNEFISRMTYMIMFLNKKDEFAMKIEESPINVCKCFNGFDADNVHNGLYEDSIQYIQDYFRSFEGNHRQIFFHTTCATDTNNIEKVFNDIRYLIGPTTLYPGGLI